MDEPVKLPKIRGKSIIPIVSDHQFFPSKMLKADPYTRKPIIGVRCPLCHRSIIGVYRRDGITEDKCGECGFDLENITWKPLVKVLFQRSRFEKIMFWIQTQALLVLKFFLSKTRKGDS